jgi:hypothetical protein
MSRAPDVYLHGHHDSVLRSHQWRTAENSAGYLLARLPATARVLDVGCGPGTITADLSAGCRTASGPPSWTGSGLSQRPAGPTRAARSPGRPGRRTR